MSSPAIASEREGRQVIAAVNETEILREALIFELRKLGVLYCVGKRRPISELTPEQQEKVREAYKDTLWASDYSVEICGVYTTLRLAEEACKERNALYPHANYFYTKAPIDNCWPDKPVFGPGAHQFPGSDALELYENMEAATLAVPVSEMRALEAGMQAVEAEITRLQEIVKQARCNVAAHRT